MADLDVALRLRLQRSGFPEGQREVTDFKRALDKLGAAPPTALPAYLQGVDKQVGNAKASVEALQAAASRLGVTRAGGLAESLAKAEANALKAEARVKSLGDAVERLPDGRGIGLAGVLQRSEERAQAAREEVDRLRRSSERLSESKGAQAFARHFQTIRNDAAATERVLRAAQQFGSGVRPASEGAASLATNAGRAWTAIGSFVAPALVLKGMNDLAEGFRTMERSAADTVITLEKLDPNFEASLRKMDKRLGAQIGIRQQQIQEARARFSAGGIDAPAQEKLLPPVLRAAVASGAPAGDLADALRTYVKTMGGDPGESQAALDMIAKAGKLGTFETKDIARNLPKLGAMFAAGGSTGRTGLADALAMMEVTAMGAGSPDEAATNLQNYGSKITAPDTIANFKKKGVNLPRLIDQAKRQGQSPELAVLDKIQELTGGDEVKIGDLFIDQEVRAALRPMLKNRQLLEDYRTQILNGSAGTTDRDYAYRVNTPAGREDAQAARREVARLNMGEAINPGAERASDAATRFMEHFAGISEIYLKKGAAAALDAAVGLTPPSLEKQDEREASNLRSEIDAKEGELSYRQGVLDSVRGKVPDQALQAQQAEMQRLTDEIAGLRTTLRSLEETLKKGGASPISYRSGMDEARIWKTSFSAGDVPASMAPGRRSVRLPFGGRAYLPDAPGGGRRRVPPGAEPMMPDVPGGGADGPNGEAVVEAGRGWTMIRRADGSIVRRTGARNWRNNNPGNIEYGDFARGAGAIGTDGRFAVFASYEAGRAAKEKLLFEGKGYAGKTLGQAITRYAPPSENNTASYIAQVAAAAGVSPDTPLSQLSSAQRKRMLDAMERVEGFKRGKETVVRQGTKRGAAPFLPGGARRAPVSYVNGGATRNHPITPELMEQIQRGVAAVYGPGYSAQIYSGGQNPLGVGGSRTGSTRHDDHGRGGEAADLYVIGPDGRRVTGEALARLGQHWVATKQGGVGLEMRGGGIHLDEHKGRAPHWNYAGQGGRYTPGMRAIMDQGLRGIPPAYADPAALEPSRAQAFGGARTGSGHPSFLSWLSRLFGSPDPDKLRDAHEAMGGRFPEDRATRQRRRPAPQPGAGAGPGRAPSATQRSGPPMVVHQHFAGVDPGLQARRASREMRRSIKMAEAAALHDTQVPIA